MKLRTKLLSSFSVVLLLTAALGVTGLVVASNVTKTVDSITVKWLPSLGYLSQIDTSSSELRLEQLKLIILPESQKEAKSDIQASLGEIITNIDKYAPTVSLPEERKIWGKITEDYDAVLVSNNSIVNSMINGNPLEAMNEYNASDTSYNDLKINLKTLLDLNKSNGLNEATVVGNTVKVGQTIQISVTALAVIIGLLVSLLMAFYLTKSIKRLSGAINTVANGDLTLANLNNKSKDEIGIMARAIDKMVENLRLIVIQVIDSSQHLGASSEELSAASEEASASSEQISATIEQLALGASDQAKSVEDISAIINNLSSSSQQVATNAETVSQSSAKVAQAAQQGVHLAGNAVEKIDGIKRVSAETAEVVTGLGNQSQQIGEIVGVIKGIADQTNLLALNAAIEAARAGEQGRGFAVVAEEVRKLAEQSSASAEQIANLIGNIQRETVRAVQVMEKGTIEVAAGVAAVNSTGTAFQTIVSEIDLVVEQIRHVSEATKQMASDTTQAVQSILGIGAIAEQTAASAQEVSAASEEQTATMESVSKSSQDLASLGEQLTGLVATFKID